MTYGIINKENHKYIIRKDKAVIDSYLKSYPRCGALFFFNQR